MASQLRHQVTLASCDAPLLARAQAESAGHDGGLKEADVAAAELDLLLDMIGNSQRTEARVMPTLCRSRAPALLVTCFRDHVSSSTCHNSETSFVSSSQSSLSLSAAPATCRTRFFNPLPLVRVLLSGTPALAKGRVTGVRSAPGTQRPLQSSFAPTGASERRMEYCQLHSDTVMTLVSVILCERTCTVFVRLPRRSSKPPHVTDSLPSVAEIAGAPRFCTVCSRSPASFFAWFASAAGVYHTILFCVVPLSADTVAAAEAVRNAGDGAAVGEVASAEEAGEDEAALRPLLPSEERSLRSLVSRHLAFSRSLRN